MWSGTDQILQRQKTSQYILEQEEYLILFQKEIENVSH